MQTMDTKIKELVLGNRRETQRGEEWSHALLGWRSPSGGAEPFRRTGLPGWLGATVAYRCRESPDHKRPHPHRAVQAGDWSRAVLNAAYLWLERLDPADTIPAIAGIFHCRAPPCLSEAPDEVIQELVGNEP